MSALCADIDLRIILRIQDTAGQDEPVVSVIDIGGDSGTGNIIG